MAYSYQLDRSDSAYPFRVSDPETGVMFWTDTEEEARDHVRQGNSRIMLPREGCESLSPDWHIPYAREFDEPFYSGALLVATPEALHDIWPFESYNQK